MTELQMIVTQKADQLDLIDVNKMLETLAQRKNYLEMVKHFIQFELFTLLFNLNCSHFYLISTNVLLFCLLC